MQNTIKKIQLARLSKVTLGVVSVLMLSITHLALAQDNAGENVKDDIQDVIQIFGNKQYGMFRMEGALNEDTRFE